MVSGCLYQDFVLEFVRLGLELRDEERVKQLELTRNNLQEVKDRGEKLFNDFFNKMELAVSWDFTSDVIIYSYFSLLCFLFSFFLPS